MSDLLKIHYAVNNDQRFASRVRIACRLAKAEYNNDSLLFVAQQVCHDIKLLGDYQDGVDTSEVTDVAIELAVAKLPTLEPHQTGAVVEIEGVDQ